MTKASSVLTLSLFLLLAGAGPARADITAFVGLSPTPHNHSVVGLSGGLSMIIIGFEAEYAHIAEDQLEALPSLKTVSGNVLLQTPIDVGGTQYYATAGVTGYREYLESGSAVFEETHVGVNIGGGAKIKLVGPVRVRVDYRVFKLRGNPINSVYQRLYVGGNVRF